MPHAEIKYSTNLTVDAPAILAAIESVILDHDSGAGDCKGRGYPTSHYYHSHVHISIAVLAKPHRDEAFFKALLSKLETRIKAMIPEACYVSVELELLSAYYSAGPHIPSN
ncbi:hypothetical protein DL239_07965 [Sedimentitalea sp. CY04]|uniref:5-carboxymethyl-2-hydroxymuconate isomerase n=1 Tax=Parasedimentitalea denitrificans TaxID=2211118 RepID=A0ABX0W5I8_9RHOB|nr:hypothetical protein [Sedimentitalea sp. CY04]NIZ60908.1 hypothetical protein [Sedimentitalea sp. CY04]